MDNRLYLTKAACSNIICIGIGTNKRRRVWLSDDDALKLAYRLMSLGSGGETRGAEEFPPTPLATF